MKTIERVCLRCDWEGESRDPDCPRCGTRLWVPHDAEEPRARRGPLAWFQAFRRARGADRVDVEAPQAPAARPSEGPPDRPVEPGRAERRRAWIPVVVVVVLAAIVVTVVRAGAPPPAVDPWASTLGGQILYAAPDPEDPATWRLWVWDVATATATEGPRLDQPQALVSVSLGVRRWVGSVATTPTGQRAQMTRNFGPDDAAVTVLEGDQATWDAEGTRAFAVTKAADCDAYEVRRFDPTTFVTDGSRQEPRCGEAVSLAAVGGSAYVTLDDAGVTTVRSALSAGAESLANGAVGLAGSGSDLLMALGDGVMPAEAAVLSLTPGPTGNVRPVGDRLDPLRIEQVLASDRYGIGTLVLGTYEGRRGIWAVPTHELGELEPELLSATDAATVGATMARDGSVILVLDGAFYLVRGGVGGSRLDLALPEGGPAPGGAVLWMEVPAE